MITHSVEINRSPDEVFAYLDQCDRHHEWQRDLVRSRVVTEGPTRVGTQIVDTRRMGKREQDVPYEVTEHDPPRRSAFRGTAGPIRPSGMVTVEPLDGGTRSRVTLSLDLRGHGLLGMLLAPLARRQAAGSVPASQERLKEVLDSGAS